jgi:hypothetical protein
MSNKTYLVWLDGLRGPEPQIWFGKQTDGNGKDKKCLSIKELTPDETKIGIFELARRYPFEAKE